MKWLKRISGIFAVVIIFTILFSFIFPEKLLNISVSLQRSKAGLALKEISAGDHTIKYLENGAKGETIVLLHGFSAEKDNWSRMAAFMTGYHLVIPDLPGFGESTRSESAKYDVESQVERLDKFFTLIGLKKFFIGGNSMGGNISGIYAIRHPDKVKGVILLNNSGVTAPVKSSLMKLFDKGENPLLINNTGDFNRMMKLLFVKEPFFPYPVKKVLVEKSVKNRVFNDKVFKDLMSKPAMFEGHFAEFTMPVLIIWGDKDQLLDVSAVSVLEKGIKRHSTKILKDCGHAPMLEKPEETASYFRFFIEDNKK